MSVWDSDKDHPNMGRLALWIVAGAVFFLVLWIVLASSVWGLRVATAGLVGRGEARIQIQSAEFRITAYNHFFDLCAAVQGHEGQIESLQIQLTQTETTRSRELVLASLAGVTAQRARSIAQYNQDALKDYTQGQFMDSDLPYQLVVNTYPEGGRTQCALQ